ncbi:MAG: peptidase M28 family protein [Alphaproteobacteria bacterium PA2]|nr:MAG: peptidase M28 family protein [Alphaproteobacteria bacterium PA2]
MKKLLTASCFAALFFASSATAADLAQEAQALRAKALADPTAWEVLESLTTEVGARSVGTPAIVRAKDWGLAKLTALGFENVHAEPFTSRAWVRGAESAEVVSPFPQKLSILGLGWSSSTPPGGLEAEVVLFKSLQELQAQPVGALKGKIAVISQAMRRTQGPDGYGSGVAPRSIGAAEAAKRGAVGFLVRSISTDDTRLPHTGSMRGEPGIPAAALSVPDAELLEHMMARGKPVKVRLNLSSTVIPQAQSWNVVGELKGAVRPEEVIVVGGHLDSWDPGTGAIDDASGIAIATSAARLAGTEGGRPARTLRVVMWGSEEQGGSGAAYALAHKDEAAKIVLAGESDLGGDEIWRARLPKGSLAQPAMKAFATVLPDLKVILSREPADEGGADVEGLKEAGVPVVDFDQDASRYFDLHHSADDTLDKVDPKKLAQNVAVWAAFLRVTANSDIDFRKSAVAP